MMDIFHLPDALFQRIHHFEFNLMGRSSRINAHNQSLTNLDLRILEFGHYIIRIGATQQKHRHEERNESVIVEGPLTKIEFHNKPPTLVSDGSGKGLTSCPLVSRDAPETTT